MVSSVMVDRFPSKGDQRELQGGHQGKRFSAARRDSIVNLSPCALTPGKEKKSKEETRHNVGIISVLSHSGHQCSVLGHHRKEVIFKSKYSARTSKRADSGAQSLEWRGVDLQSHSDAQVSRMFKREFL
ncbi:hypothetical protein PIB30_057985 [Stylosanthes scabra]|uniref:Uncharacterized protein n=1 Tax=Stylosanthes scabra TaxID=79078 RepID=A0ABU6UND8_9FABA|nr:hypothetical protein [Stylosanthes scabra]